MRNHIRYEGQKKILLRAGFMLAAVLLFLAGTASAEDLPAVGSVVTFGRYEQNNNSDDGAEPIEWIVLSVSAQDQTAKLISRYLLDARPYSAADQNTTWETSDLRAWLNADFADKAFTEAEMAAILPAETAAGILKTSLGASPKPANGI